MSELKTESPPPTATSTSVSTKRERGSSPEVDATASAPSKKVKGDDGEASPAPAPVSASETVPAVETQEPVVEKKDQEQTVSNNTATNGNGEKMDDVQATGEVLTLLVRFHFHSIHH